MNSVLRFITRQEDPAVLREFDRLLKETEVPTDKDRLTNAIHDVAQIRLRIDHSLEEDNGTVEGQLAELGQKLHEVSSYVDDADSTNDPGATAQQLEYLASHLEEILERLGTVDDSIRAHRSRIATLLRQVESARRNVSERSQKISSIENGRPCDANIQRKREKELAKLRPQLESAQAKLAKKEGDLTQDERLVTAQFPVETTEDDDIFRVGAVMAEIAMLVDELDPSLADIEDPKKRFAALFREAKNNVSTGNSSGYGTEKETSTGKSYSAVKEYFDLLVDQMAALYEEAFDDAEQEIADVNSANGRRTDFFTRQNQFSGLVQRRFGEKVGSNGTFVANYKTANRMLDQVPTEFSQAMDMFERIETTFRVELERRSRAIEELEQGDLSRHKRGHLEVLGRDQFGNQVVRSLAAKSKTKYKQDLARRAGLTQALRNVTVIKRGIMLNSPIAALKRWSRKAT